MEFNEESYHQIHLYLKGKLPEAEKKAFETALSNDPALQEALQKHKAAEVIVTEAYLQQVRQVTQQVIKEKRRFKGTQLGAGLAIVALLSGVGLYYLNHSPSVAPPAQRKTVPTATSVKDSASPVEPTVRATAPTLSKSPSTEAKTTPHKEALSPVPQPTVDLERMAQEEYLKNIDKKSPSVKEKGPEVAPKQEIKNPVVKVNEPNHNTVADTATTPISDTTKINNQVLFDIVYDLNTQEGVLLPVTQTEGQFKILDHTGRVLHTAAYSNSEAVWQGSAGLLEANTQLTVILMDGKGNTVGLGKISIVK